MQDLRKFLAWIFAVTSLLCLWTSFWFVPRIIHLHYVFSPLRGLLVAAAAALFPILATIYGVAWWAVWKEKASARGWGIAASLIHVLISLSLIVLPLHPVTSCTWPVLATGIFGLVVFLSRYEPHDSSHSGESIADGPGGQMSEVMGERPFQG
jgi:hypothetical protein